MKQSIPEGWSVKKLEECFSFSAGGDVDKDCFSETKDDLHPYPIYANALTNEGLYGYSSKYKVKEECITITGRGDIGNVFYRKGYFTPIVRLITAIPNTGINAKFMSYACSQIHFFDESTGVPQLTVPQVQWYKILLPPLSEQEKIAGILGMWDEAIEKLSGLIEQKKLLKKGLMQKLLTGKTRLPGFSQLWKDVKLKEMGHITSAGVDKNIVPGEQNVTLLNYMDVYKKDFIYKDDIKQIVTAPDRKIKNCNVLMGDVFFTPSSETRDDIGHSAVIMENIPGAVYSYHVVRFRPLLNHLKRTFCAYAFKTVKFYKQAYSLCEGSGQRYVLSQDYFRNMSIFIPIDLEEQQAIADILSTADDEINLLNQKLEAIKEQKKGLMQQLLTGQIRVKVN